MPITRAGTPATIDQGSTSWVITALAATIVVTAEPESMPPADGYVPHKDTDNTSSSHGNEYRGERRRNRRFDGTYRMCKGQAVVE